MSRTRNLILSDSVIRELLKMYLIADVCRETGLESPAIRLFVSGKNETLKTQNAIVLTKFLQNHYEMLHTAFAGTDDEWVTLNKQENITDRWFKGRQATHKARVNNHNDGPIVVKARKAKADPRTVAKD